MQETHMMSVELFQIFHFNIFHLVYLIFYLLKMIQYDKCIFI